MKWDDAGDPAECSIRAVLDDGAGSALAGAFQAAMYSRSLLVVPANGAVEGDKKSALDGGRGPRVRVRLTLRVIPKVPWSGREAFKAKAGGWSSESHGTL